MVTLGSNIERFALVSGQTKAKGGHELLLGYGLMGLIRRPVRWRFSLFNKNYRYLTLRICADLRKIKDLADRKELPDLWIFSP